MGLGPLLVGMLSDGFSAYGDEAVRYALSLGVSLGVVGSIAYLGGSAKYASATALIEGFAGK